MIIIILQYQTSVRYITIAGVTTTGSWAVDIYIKVKGVLDTYTKK